MKRHKHNRSLKIQKYKIDYRMTSPLFSLSQYSHNLIRTLITAITGSKGMKDSVIGQSLNNYIYYTYLKAYIR